MGRGVSAPQPPRGYAALRVALLSTSADSAAAGDLASFLSGAGATVVHLTRSADASAGAGISDAGAGAVDGVVVLLSAAALADRAWMAAAKSLAGTRVIPIRLGPLNAELVPADLREPNWIDWTPGEATLGLVLAGLVSDPSRRAVSRQLAHAAESWNRGRRSDSLLIDDYRRARQMRDVLAELNADPMAVPGPVTVAFVRRSVLVARKRHRRRLRWRVGAAAAAVAALAAAAVYLPRIAAGKHSNQEAIATTGDPAEMADLPEWSAANAGALLLNGTVAEQQLARATMLQAFAQPWRISNADWLPNVNTIVPYDQGTRALVLYLAGPRTGLAAYDIRTGQVLWSQLLSRAFRGADISPSGTMAVLAGDGIASVSLRSHRVKTIVSQGHFASIRLTGPRSAVADTPQAGLVRVDLGTGAVTQVGSYSSILALQATGRQSATALVMRAPGHYQIMNAASGRVVASAAVAGPLQGGAVSPGGTEAVVAGGDGQFWSFGAHRVPEPTGIPVPTVFNSADWVPGGRLIVASDDESGQVFYLPRAEFLGTVCHDVPRLQLLRYEPGTDLIACVGAGTNSFWHLPPAPLNRPNGLHAPTMTSTAAGVTIKASGSQMRLFLAGRRSTAEFDPLNAAITAVQVSGNGQQVVVGALDGQAAIVDVGPSSVVTAGVWNVPDAAPVVAAGWHGNLPFVISATGQSWAVSECGQCATDRGLLRELHSRLTGCFTARQMKYIADNTRQELGLRTCPLPSSVAGG